MSELTSTPQEPQQDFLSRSLFATLNLDLEKGLYILFIILALITRFYALGDRVVSHDESLHTQFSYQFYNGDGYVHQALMHGPFLFHATAASYWLFGDNDFTSRIPVALLGVILVALPYLLRDWLGRKGALFTSFIFLISPYLLYYSRYIRHDIYVITWALMVFIATIYYLRQTKTKYLWWFAAGLALMFATKEVAYIYVAIFGSFLVLRLLAKIIASDWFTEEWHKIVLPLGIMLLGGVMLGVGYLLHGRIAETDPGSSTLTFLNWVQVTGFFALLIGVFMGMNQWQHRLKEYASYDLIVLYVTLLLPLMSALVITLSGLDPLNKAMQTCSAVDGSTLNFFQKLLLADCWSAWFSSGPMQSGIFVTLLLVIGALIGLWWDWRRWIVAALVFHTIFAVLYTSVFTNLGGWGNGMVESLGYWLVQQEVARGGQPEFYYLLVVPFYEFLPVIFSLAAIFFWFRKTQFQRTVGFWVLLFIIAAIAYSFFNWIFNRPIGGTLPNLGSLLLTLGIIGAWLAFRWLRRNLNLDDPVFKLVDMALLIWAAVRVIFFFATLPINGAVREEPVSWPGILTALLVVVLGGAVWFRSYRQAKRDSAEISPATINWRTWLNDILFEFVPHLIWWMLLTWVAYTVAGEKMPWLSTHFVIPMGFLSGWYLNEKLKDTSVRELFSVRSLLLIGLVVVALIALGLMVKTLLVDVEWGSKTLANLTNTGMLIGRLILVVAAFGLIYYLGRRSKRKIVRHAWLLGIFTALVLLTIRFSFMANYVNDDNSNEFLVYAHGGPATKAEVLRQLEAVSMRQFGDKSVKVAFDNDSSWPFTWYLRDYPNRLYFGENPTPDILDAPVLIVGNDNWGKVDPIVGDDYVHDTYVYLQWPMEEYRQLGWDAFFGLKAQEGQERGLGSRQIRQALSDIFLYRDYSKYGEIFNGDPNYYRLGKWPVRDELRIYLRRDALEELWDSGTKAGRYEPPVDPYELGDLALQAERVIGQGSLATPRNVAVAPDGTLFVADSGNHRIVAFDADGTMLTSWGSFGANVGEFNEPWGIAADDEFVYVADTWNYRIQKFTHDGDFVASFGSGGTVDDGSAETGNVYFGPRSIALYEDDKLIIADTGNHRLQVVDRDGNFIQFVGEFGAQLGQFFEPVGVTVGPNGAVYVADTWNRRVQALTQDLLPFIEWPIDGWRSDSLENKPYVATDSASQVYVTDPEAHRVLIFDAAGFYLGRFGRFGPEIDNFNIPNGIAIGPDDSMYVADVQNNRVLKFAPVGALLPPVAPAPAEQ
ncbi:MAG: TIGR03663 family protein [Anaerolineae bacterium]|nr:TIGR03663 family protein [Anaerolineae bacterium]